MSPLTAALLFAGLALLVGAVVVVVVRVLTKDHEHAPQSSATSTAWPPAAALFHTASVNSM